MARKQEFDQRNYISSVIRQKDECQIGVFQENKADQIFRKTNISYLLIRTRTCAHQGVRNVSFSENLTCFLLLKHLFWDSPFCLISDDYVKIAVFCWNIFNKNIAKLVIDNVVSEKLKFKLTQVKFLQKVLTQSNLHEHDYSIHWTIFYRPSP